MGDLLWSTVSLSPPGRPPPWSMQTMARQWTSPGAGSGWGRRLRVVPRRRELLATLEPTDQCDLTEVLALLDDEVGEELPDRDVGAFVPHEAVEVVVGELVEEGVRPRAHVGEVLVELAVGDRREVAD